MANTAPDGTQSKLFDLAAAWLKLATDLDSNEALRKKIKGVKVFPPQKVENRIAVSLLGLALDSSFPNPRARTTTPSPAKLGRKVRSRTPRSRGRQPHP